MSSKNNLNKLLDITDKELNNLHFYFYLIDKNLLYSILNKQNTLEYILKKIETKILNSKIYKSKTQNTNSKINKSKSKTQNTNSKIYKSKTQKR